MKKPQSIFKRAFGVRRRIPMGILALATAFLLTAWAVAPAQAVWEENDSSGEVRQPPHGQNAELEQALKECMETAGTDAQGRPDMDAMDECMSAKGFEKPDGPPPGGPGGGRDSSSE